MIKIGSKPYYCVEDFWFPDPSTLNNYKIFFKKDEFYYALVAYKTKIGNGYVLVYNNNKEVVMDYKDFDKYFISFKKHKRNEKLKYLLNEED